MNSAIERLLSLRVGDIMNRDVVPLSASATIGDAAELFSNKEITGAPVVDAKGRCVGVLSVTDLALREYRAAKVGDMVAWGSDVTLTAENRADLLPSEIDPSQRIEDHMSPVVQTVDVGAPIMSAARVLCREHIHRLIIVDEKHRPVGVLSSLDLVASMVAAIEE